MTLNSPEFLSTFRAGRPLEQPLDAYWNAPSGNGPLAGAWKDKPHRLVYDLIAALVHATQPNGTLLESPQLKSLRDEYRPSMNDNVLHPWAADVVAAIDQVGVPAASVEDRLDADRLEAAEAVWLCYDFNNEVEAADGWERTSPGDEWTRKIYLRGEGPDAPTVPGAFTVIFEPASACFSDAFAHSNGVRIGNCR